MPFQKLGSIHNSDARQPLSESPCGFRMTCGKREQILIRGNNVSRAACNRQLDEFLIQRVSVIIECRLYGPQVFAQIAETPQSNFDSLLGELGIASNDHWVSENGS